MAIFNDGSYYHALDRFEEQDSVAFGAPIIEGDQPREGEWTSNLGLKEIGTSANPLLTNVTKGLELNEWGNIKADPKTGKTTKDKVWAGGDITLGQATVILAMGMGKDSAVDINKYLQES